MDIEIEIYKILAELDKSTWSNRYKGNLTETQMLLVDYIIFESFFKCNMLPKPYYDRLDNLFNLLLERGVL